MGKLYISCKVFPREAKLGLEENDCGVCSKDIYGVNLGIIKMHW